MQPYFHFANQRTALIIDELIRPFFYQVSITSLCFKSESDSEIQRHNSELYEEKRPECVTRRGAGICPDLPGGYNPLVFMQHPLTCIQQSGVITRDVRNGFFKFGSVLIKTAGSVRFRFGFEKKPPVRFGFFVDHS